VTPPLGSAKVLYAFIYDAPGTSRLLVITPTARMKEFFRDLEAGGPSFGSGTPEDRETLRGKPVGPALCHAKRSSTSLAIPK
jgi:hypothetical protein